MPVFFVLLAMFNFGFKLSGRIVLGVTRRLRLSIILLFYVFNLNVFNKSGGGLFAFTGVDYRDYVDARFFLKIFGKALLVLS